MEVKDNRVRRIMKGTIFLLIIFAVVNIFKVFDNED